MRKQRVFVMRDLSAKVPTPLAVCFDMTFIRVNKIFKNESVSGKGRHIECLVGGILVDLWQEYERDNWYVWREI